MEKSQTEVELIFGALVNLQHHSNGNLLIFNVSENELCVVPTNAWPLTHTCLYCTEYERKIGAISRNAHVPTQIQWKMNAKIHGIFDSINIKN